MLRNKNIPLILSILSGSSLGTLAFDAILGQIETSTLFYIYHGVGILLFLISCVWFIWLGRKEKEEITHRS